MTREDLENALDIIGWRIVNSGNKLNDFIINNYGMRSEFVVTEDECLEVRCDLFGGSFLGTFKCRLSAMKLETGKITDNGEICRVSLLANENCVISFYNHDIK